MQANSKNILKKLEKVHGAEYFTNYVLLLFVAAFLLASTCYAWFTMSETINTQGPEMSAYSKNITVSVTIYNKYGQQIAADTFESGLVTMRDFLVSGLIPDDSVYIKLTVQRNSEDDIAIDIGLDGIVGETIENATTTNLSVSMLDLFTMANLTLIEGQTQGTETAVFEPTHFTRGQAIRLSGNANGRLCILANSPWPYGESSSAKDYYFELVFDIPDDIINVLKPNILAGRSFDIASMYILEVAS